MRQQSTNDSKAINHRETFGCHVALKLDFGRKMGRDLLEGILNYSRKNGVWRFFNCQWKDPDIDLFEGCEKSGMIVHLAQPWNPDDVLKHIPAVNIGTSALKPGIPSVVTDEIEVGRMAADYLLEKGLRSFGYIGYSEPAYAGLRLEGFQEKLDEKGMPVSVFPHKLKHRERFADSKEDMTAISQWLLGLEKPCGLFAANDHLASQVIGIALDNKLSVPEELAVLGVDNDIVTCEMAPVPLSSVIIPRNRQGFMAAEMLDNLMSGEPVGQDRRYVYPIEVETRMSTELLADAPPVLSVAYYYIQRNAHLNLSVNDVARKINASRRYLEHHFKDKLGTSPYDEIIKARLKQARQLAAETDMRVGEIAEASGFKETKTFASALAREVGMTPTEFVQSIRENFHSTA